MQRMRVMHFMAGQGNIIVVNSQNGYRKLFTGWAFSFINASSGTAKPAKQIYVNNFSPGFSNVFNNSSGFGHPINFMLARY